MATSAYSYGLLPPSPNSLLYRFPPHTHRTAPRRDTRASRGRARAQHSPQRTADSFGIVVERERAPHELDGLRWYTDFEACETVLWERYFHCADLGRDLVPVVGEPCGFDLREDLDRHVLPRW